VAYWDRFGRPEKPADYGLDLQTWWIDPEKERALVGKRKGLGRK
jgi:microcin C transport system substrate-binding protein